MTGPDLPSPSVPKHKPEPRTRRRYASGLSGFDPQKSRLQSGLVDVRLTSRPSRRDSAKKKRPARAQKNPLPVQVTDATNGRIMKGVTLRVGLATALVSAASFGAAALALLWRS